MTIPGDLFLHRVDIEGDVVEVRVLPPSYARMPVVSAQIVDIGEDELVLAPQRVELRRPYRSRSEIEARCRTAVDQIQRSGDPALLDLWIDLLARAALVELIWIFPRFQNGASLRIRGAVVEAASITDHPAHVDALVDAVAVFATRPHRLGRRLAETAGALGGRASGLVWNLDDFALLLPSARGEVTVDYRRTPTGKLRTRARAARGLLDDATLQTRVREQSAQVRRAGAVVHVLDGEHLVIEADGALVDRAPLAELVELVARLVAPAGGTAPYR